MAGKNKEKNEGANTIDKKIHDINTADKAADSGQQRLKDMMEMLPAYVVLLSSDYHVPYANRFFRERFGEAKGRRCYEYLFNREEPCEVCESYKALKTNKPHRWEWNGPDNRIYDIYDLPFNDTNGSRMILEMGIDITESKQAKEALEELNKNLEQRVAERTAEVIKNEEKYRTLFEMMNEGFALDEIIYDADGKPYDLRYLAVNPAFEKQTGLKMKDIIGRTALELFPKAEPVWFERYGEVLKTGIPANFEEKFGPLGRWFEVMAFRIDERRFATLLMDITERKRKDMALRESEDRLKHAQEIAHVGSWELDLVEDTLIWSDEVFRIFGLEPQQFRATYRGFLELIHPDDRVKVDDAYKNSVREGRHEYDIEHRILRPDGTVRVVREKCYHVKDDAGRIIKSVGMVHDITDEKLQEEQRLAKAKAESALKELQDFLRLFETVDVAIMLIERGGTVKYANNRAKAMLQIHSGDVITDHFDKDVIAAKSFANEIYFSRGVKRSFLISRQDYRDMFLLVVGSMQEEIAKGKKILSAAPYTLDDIVGLDRIKGKIRELAVQNVNILLLGESGTGKELFASAIHNASPRAGGKFVVVHCGAIPDTLFESELFGHEKGAYTDARSARVGKIEYANDGTVFFDELGDLPLTVQSKLLRVIEDKHIVPVGGNEPKGVDVRFVFATNRDLEEMVKKKEFREDLYYRVNSITVKIPPLRERKEELGDLIKHFTAKMQMTFNRYISDVSPETRSKLLAYDFPGNVRELEGLIRNAFLSSKGDKIEIADLKFETLDRETINVKVKKYHAQLVYEHFLMNNKDYKETAKDLKISTRQVYRYVKLAEE